MVIALLLALTFLGLVGYTIGTQEHGNATYFSDAAKEFEFPISRDELFDWSLRQIILGTYQHEERQSACTAGTCRSWPPCTATTPRRSTAKA